VAFNAVGVSNTKILGVSFTELDAGQFALPITAYTTSSFVTARLAARRMIPNKSGVIMTVTALPAPTGTPLNGGYGPASAAKEALTRDLSLEFAPHGIRVTCSLGFLSLRSGAWTTLGRVDAEHGIRHSPNDGHDVARRSRRPGDRIERIEAEQHEERVHELVWRDDRRRVIGDSLHQLGEHRAAAFVSAADDLGQIGIGDCRRREAAVREAAVRPEAPKQRYELVQRDEWVRLGEDLTHLCEWAADGERVEERLEQLRLRLELIVHGHARDAGAARDGVDRECLRVVGLEQLAPRGEDALAALVDGFLPLDRRVGSWGHGLGRADMARPV
jgi:Enoyl-(Acyl carrier protein) reductase